MTHETATVLRQLIDQELAADSVTPAEAAARIVKKMRRSHPELLDAWLQEQAVATVSGQIGDLLRSLRGQAMGKSGAARFKAALDSGEIGVALLETWHAVSEENAWLRLADMTGEHHRFVADHYQERAEANLMREAFHRVLAKKVGQQRTADVLTEEECQRILDSATRKAAGRAA